MRVRVRRAEPDDLGAVVAFGSAVVPPHYAPILGHRGAQAQLGWWTAEQLAPALAAGRVHLAETETGTGTELVGVCQTGELDGHQVIWKLYVARTTGAALSGWSCCSRRSPRSRRARRASTSSTSRATPAPLASTSARASRWCGRTRPPRVARRAARSSGVAGGCGSAAAPPQIELVPSGGLATPVVPVFCAAIRSRISSSSATSAGVPAGSAGKYFSLARV